MKHVVTTTITERAHLDKASLEYRRLLSKIARARLTAERKIADINAALDQETEADVNAADVIFVDIQSWAILHKDATFPESKKSMEVAGAKIGFRICPPSIKQVRGMKAEHSLAKLKVLSGDTYIRTVEEINKEALLTNQKELGPAYFASAGLYVFQDEKFFVDPISDVLEQKTETVNQ